MLCRSCVFNAVQFARVLCRTEDGSGDCCRWSNGEGGGSSDGEGGGEMGREGMVREGNRKGGKVYLCTCFMFSIVSLCLFVCFFFANSEYVKGPSAWKRAISGMFFSFFVIVSLCLLLFLLLCYCAHSEYAEEASGDQSAISSTCFMFSARNTKPFAVSPYL